MAFRELFTHAKLLVHFCSAGELLYCVLVTVQHHVHDGKPTHAVGGTFTYPVGRKCRSQSHKPLVHLSDDQCAGTADRDATCSTHTPHQEPTVQPRPALPSKSVPRCVSLM